VVRALLLLGLVALEAGDYEHARMRLCEGLSLQRELGSSKIVAPLVFGLGRVSLGEGEIAAARGHFAEAVVVRQQIEGALGPARLREHLAGDTLLRLPVGENSQQEWERARELTGLFADPSVAPVVSWQAPYRRAALLFGAATALGEPVVEVGSPPPELPPVARAAYEQHLSTVRQALGKDAFQACWERGRTLTPDQVWWHLMWDEQW
jgi:hypothetical protein